MARRRAVLIPGQFYDTRAPLFAYTGETLRRAGFDLHEISWQVPAGLDEDRSAAWVAEQVAPALTEPTDLLVGKSLGSLAAPLAVDRRLPAVWLTPLLHLPEVMTALERATAPFLLIGGLADPTWDAAEARRLTSHMLEIPDADHSLMVPGPLVRSADALGRVCLAVDAFVQINRTL
ncbi:alpha/beta hydrolase [Micromonospora sp. WMMD812]|uniref:alpha/beta hydrolase n=1 Tax=Micromonospora sp. WMMD812 TaxID=3015152 RepID=UPI00248C6DF9|nr:alpha/beta hydrolase [Micromonospora sp. WMMD812]WBB65666.1 alpha/beta hydrolase [Micromonospora sp. WMMD812]